MISEEDTDVTSTRPAGAQDGVTYDAFISYRRRDGSGVARWIYDKLRSFRLPEEVVARLRQDKQELHRRRPRIWLDRSYEKASDDYLEKKIYPALDRAARLIVISTPAALELTTLEDGSRGPNCVVREIDHFIRPQQTVAGPRRPIDLVLGPGATPGEWPEPLSRAARWDWIDLRLFGLWNAPWSEALDAGLAKLVATIYDVSDQDLPLIRREERRRRNKLLTGIGAAVLLFAVVVAGLATLAVWQRNVAQGRLLTAQISQSQLAAAQAVEQQDPETAVMTALQGMPSAKDPRPIEPSNWQALVDVEAKRPDLRVVRGIVAAAPIAWSPDGKYFGSADAKSLTVWNAATGRKQVSVKSHSFEVTWSPDGTIFTDSVSLYASPGGTPIANLPSGKMVGWSQDSRELMLVADGTLILVDRLGARQRTLSVPGERLTDARWSHRQDRVLALTDKSVAVLLDFPSGVELFRWSLKRSTLEAAEWNPDDSFIAFASADGIGTTESTVQTFNSKTGASVANFDVKYLRHLQFSPDGLTLLLHAADRVTINMVGGRQVDSAAIEGGAASYSPDGRWIAIAASGGIYEWDPLRNIRRWLRWNGLAYRELSWSPTGDYLAASAASSLLVKNTNQRLAPEIDVVAAVTGWQRPGSRTIDPADDLDSSGILARKAWAGTFVATLSDDRLTFHVFNIKTKTVIANMSSGNAKIATWSWNTYSLDRVAVFFADGTVKQWSEREGITTFSGKQVGAQRIFWGDGFFVSAAPDNEQIWRSDQRSSIASYPLKGLEQSSVFSSAKLILTRSADGTVALRDLKSGAVRSTLDEASSDVASVFWERDSRQLITISSSSQAVLWDAASGKKLAGWVATTNSPVAWAPSGDHVITITSDHTCDLRDSSTGIALAHFKDCWSASWSPSGSRVLLGCNRTARFVDANSGNTLAELSVQGSPLSWEASWDPAQEKVLATTSNSHFFVLRDIDGHTLQALTIPEPWIVRGAWDRQGDKLVVFAGDRIVSAFGNARVFDVETGRELAVFRGHQKNILGGSWDPTGQKLLTWSQDNTGRVWDVETGRELALLEGYPDFVGSGGWSHDGNEVLISYLIPPTFAWDASHFSLPVNERIDWLRASLAVPETAVSLGQEPTNQGGPASSSELANRCARGAENPADPNRIWSGVTLPELFYVPDLESDCRAALSNNPSSGRLAYLLGRILLGEDHEDEALSMLERAWSQGYLMAGIDLGSQLLYSTNEQLHNAERGLSMLRRAAEQSPIASAVLASYFSTRDDYQFKRYLAAATQAGTPEAHELLADLAESRAEKSTGQAAIADWLEAYGEWSKAYELSRYAEGRGEADWEHPLSRRAALAWYLAEQGQLLAVTAAYRNSIAGVP